MSDRPSYEVVVVGGGPAGLTTALYTTRLGHRTAVFEKEGGRHATARHVHNLFGVSEDVSGRELASHAVDQFQEYGGTYYLDPVQQVSRNGDGREAVDGDGTGTDDAAGDARSEQGNTDTSAGDHDPAAAADEGRFVVDAGHATVDTERLVFATGFADVDPSVPDIHRFAGRGLHYCLHCDAYALGDSPVFVLGHDDHAAHAAMVMLNFSDDVDLLLDGRDPDWSEETARRIRAHPVERVAEEVAGAFARDGRDGQDNRAGDSGRDPRAGRSGREDAPRLGGLRFADGTEREYRGGFAMYGKEYNTSLAESLGCALTDDGAVDVDDRFETSVDGAYAVGDVTHGQNQTVVALGDGAKAGVAVHKDLRRFPRPPDEIDDVGASDVPAASPELRSRMRLLRERSEHAGLRFPTPRH